MNEKNNPVRVTHQERFRILSGKAGCTDLFPLKEDLLQRGCFNFRITSWCMFPVLKKGDQIKVENVDTDKIKAGDILVYRGRHWIYAHRVIGREFVNGKEFILTRPDTSEGDPRDIKGAEQVALEDVLGKVAQIRRGGRFLPLERRRSGILERFALANIGFATRYLLLLERSLLMTLSRLQAQKLYKQLGKAIIFRFQDDINFKLVIPVSKSLGINVYKPIDEVGLSELAGCAIFHILIRLKNESIGYATFINNQENVPYQYLRPSEIFLRLRYKGIGLEEIILKKLEILIKR